LRLVQLRKCMEKRMGCYKYYIYRMLVDKWKHHFWTVIYIERVQQKKLMVKSFLFEMVIYFLAFRNFSFMLINKFYQTFWGVYWQVRKWLISSVKNCLRFFKFIYLKIYYPSFLYLLMVFITIFSCKMRITANSWGQKFLLNL
jgi:hypothetical protein